MIFRTLLLCASMTAATIVAQVGATTSANNANAQQLEGSSLATATATGVPLPPLPTLMTFNREGTVVESRRLYLPASPLGPVLATPGHGEWIRTANGQFAVTSYLFYQAAPNVATADGSVIGTEKVRLNITLHPGGRRFTGTVVVEIRNANGSVLFSGPGVIEGTRCLGRSRTSRPAHWDARTADFR